jgi:hypothetical protein
VRPAKAGTLSGSQSHRGKSRNPVAWVAGWRETKTLKPTDKAIERMVASHQAVATANVTQPRSQYPEVELMGLERRQQNSAKQTDALSSSGGVVTTAW